MKTRISKITEIKSKMSDFIKTKNSKNNNFDFKKELDNQNTIVKLNLKVEGLINENNNNKIFHKELNSIKEEFDRERGINFMLNKKV